MAYDYSRLVGKIREVFGTDAAFAEAMGLSERSVSLKVNCKVGWKQCEIDRASNLLGIQATDIGDYFFTR